MLKIVLMFPRQQITFNKECKTMSEGLDMAKAYLDQVEFDVSDVVIFFRKEV